MKNTKKSSKKSEVNDSIKVLFFGDVVGKIGRRALTEMVPRLKKEFEADFVIANAENLAHGKGITKSTLKEAQDAGVDLFTSGNHIFAKKEGIDIIAQKDSPVLRPANYPEGVPGQGDFLAEVGIKKLLVINLQGRVFFNEDTDCPFRTFDKIYSKYEKEKINGIIVDFHTEATSENVAFGYWVDGRASAVIGTHTHIPTADAKILAKGTAYLTDAGMVGSKESVLGVKKETIIERFLTQLPKTHEIPEEGLATVNAVFLEINPKTKKANKIKQITQEISIP